MPPVRTQPLLHREIPALATLPFLPLLEGPTPVEHLGDLAGVRRYLGRTGVYVKRDDLSSSIYGGNKIRKYEYVLGEARARGRSHLVTAGGIASTQVTATAVIGKALGFEVTAVLFDQPLTRFGQRALLADHAAGARLIYGGSYAGTLRASVPELLKRGRHPILPGASTPLPNLGYVDAAYEIAAQVERGEMPRPDAVVVACGSGGTVAGLAVGFARLGWETEVIGVQVSTLFFSNTPMIRTLAHQTQRYLATFDPTATRSRPRLRVDHRAIGAGYGAPTADAVRAARVMEEITGFEGEVTYTGKAFSALREIGLSPDYQHRTLLFWNTLTRTPPSIDGVSSSMLSSELRSVYEGDPQA